MAALSCCLKLSPQNGSKSCSHHSGLLVTEEHTHLQEDWLALDAVLSSFWKALQETQGQGM